MWLWLLRFVVYKILSLYQGVNSMSVLQKLYEDPEISAKYKELRQDDDYYYFYKHYSVDEKWGILKVFENFTLRYRSSFHFNDPYDCHFNPVFTPPRSKQKIIQEFSEKLSSSQFSETNTFIDQNGDSQPLEGLLGSNTPELSSINAGQYLINLKTNLFVTCFNNAPDNMLLWSHYASNHRGFMIEFKIPKKDHNGLLPLPVEYSDSLREIDCPSDCHIALKNWTSDENFNLYKDGFLVKAKDWHYEKEFRLFANLQTTFLSTFEYHDLPFPPQFINSVVLGSWNIWEVEKRNNVLKTILDFNEVNNLNIQVYQSTVHEKEFKIIFPDHPILGE